MSHLDFRRSLTDTQVKSLNATLDNFKSLLEVLPSDDTWDKKNGLSQKMLTRAFIRAIEHTAVEDLRWIVNEVFAYSNVCASNKKHTITSVTVYDSGIIFSTDTIQLNISNYNAEDMVGCTTHLSRSYSGFDIRGEPLDIQTEQKKIKASIVGPYWDSVTARSTSDGVRYTACANYKDVVLVTDDRGLLIAKEDLPRRDSITYTLIDGSPATTKEDASRDGYMFIDLNTRDIWHGSITPYDATLKLSTARVYKYPRMFVSGKFVFSTASMSMNISALGYAGGSLSGDVEGTDIPSIPVRHTVKLQRNSIIAVTQYTPSNTYFVVAAPQRMIAMYDVVAEYIMVDHCGVAEVIARCVVTAQKDSHEIVDTRVDVLNEERVAASPYKTSEAYAKEVVSMRVVIADRDDPAGMYYPQ